MYRKKMPDLNSTILGLPPGLNSPKESILRLINLFLPYAIDVETIRHYDIEKNMRALLILKKGFVEVCHSRSGWSISTVHAPYILGVGLLNDSFWNGYLRLSKNAKMSFVDLDNVPTHLFENNSPIWKDIATVLSFHLQYAGYRDSILSLRSSYSIIKSKLMELIEIPDNLRKNITIINYIVSSTSLSRSIVSRTLRELRKGNYIEMQNGTLSRINHLPERY